MVGGRLLKDIVTEGNLIVGTCTRGLPSTAEFVGSSHDPARNVSYLFYRDESFPDNSPQEQVPVINVSMSSSLRYENDKVVIHMDARRIADLLFRFMEEKDVYHSESTWQSDRAILAYPSLIADMFECMGIEFKDDDSDI